VNEAGPEIRSRFVSLLSFQPKLLTKLAPNVPSPMDDSFNDQRCVSRSIEDDVFSNRMAVDIGTEIIPSLANTWKDREVSQGIEYQLPICIHLPLIPLLQRVLQEVVEVFGSFGGNLQVMG
jgi:hypothetical protein